MAWRALAIIATLALGGCSRCGSRTSVDAGPDEAWLRGEYVPEPGAAPRAGGTLVLRVPLEPTGFSRIDDRFAEGVMVRYTTGTIYESLGRVDPLRPDAPLTPWLARRWSVEDATLSVELLEGVPFHGGTTFDAADMKAVIDAVLRPENPTVGLRGSLGPITDVAARGNTLTIRYSRPPNPFELRTLLGAVPAMPSEAFVSPYADAPVHHTPDGTGPFQFQRLVPGDRLVLTRFSKHRSAAFLDELHVRFVKDDTVAGQLWEKGEFDVMTRIPPALWRGIETQAWAWRYRRYRVDENAYAWIGWNHADALFSDVRVRRALAMLYPAEVVSKAVELGLERRTTCPYWTHSASCDASIAPLPFAPEKAKALLEEAGWRDVDGDGVREREGQRFSFRFLMASNSARLTKILPLYQEQLRAAGLELVIEPADAAQTISRMRTHDFQAAAMSWSSADAVSDQFSLFHSSQIAGGKNYVGYAGADALLEQIRDAADPIARTELERALHRKLFDDQVYLFLTVRPSLDAVKRSVHGAVPSLTWYDFSKVWVDP